MKHTPEGLSGLFAEMHRRASEHDPDSCRSPGHIVIQGDDGQRYCGIGAYDLATRAGYVHIMLRNITTNTIVRGQVIRVNPKFLRWRLSG